MPERAKRRTRPQSSVRGRTTAWMLRFWSAAFFWLAVSSISHAQQRLDLPRADGQTTPLLIYGDPSACGTVVVVSHGLGGSERAFSGLARMLVAERVTVYVMGHRESGDPTLRQAIASAGFRSRQR